MELERKLLDFSQVEMKAGPKNAGRLVGYAATFGNVDRQGDIIMPGAFSNTLDFFKTSGFMAIGHDQANLPIATVDVAKEDDMGLWVEMDFHTTPLAQEARTVAQERMERGKTVTLSIGYSTTPEGMEYREDGIRLLKSLDVYEASFANIPANPLAQVAGVKVAAAVSDTTFDDRCSALVSSADEIATLGKAMHATRVKEGRVLSAANRTKLAELHSSLQSVSEMLSELLAATEPPAKEQAKAKRKRPNAVTAVVNDRYRARLRDMEAWAAAHATTGK